ncbi:MAG: hybrid sensor histidine kinase/response regulator [Flavobacterium psychrophilum]|nr:MAG: hybrid sensor histidine kinase/response regulator [Flavobacterium psychrophilum]
MVQKPKAVKYKVITGYILLLAMAVLSVWLVYTEISKLAITQKSNEEKKILRISTTIANLYASESIGRNSILTEADADFKNYSNLIDNIHLEIDTIKMDVDPAQLSKFDSIKLLIDRKRNSISEIIAYHKKYGRKDNISQAIEGIYHTKDSIINTKKSVETKKTYPGQKSVNAILSPRLREALSKPVVPNDSLAMAYGKILSELILKEKQQDRMMFAQEQHLLEENRIISDQLRKILTTIENEFLQKSYQQIRKSELSMQNLVNNVAWIGALALIILITFAWIIIRDLSINQKYRRQLEILNQENEELLRTKSMLMATVTHDLQTPLGSIIGFHDLIKDSGITGKQKQYLSNINESANYILKLVNDLLDFSRLENNRISIEKTSFNIKNVIENTCRTLEPMAVNKGIELNWDINEELNSNFISDPYRIKQVLTNLVSNAIKFTPEGSVEVTGKIEGVNIHISVIDTGIGISKEKHSDVFKEFTQAHSGIEKKFGGTGLGLTISQKILELLDGEITLESEEGQGSIFTIIIPCIPAGGGFLPEETTSTNDVAEEYPYLRGKKILIVDDDTMQLALMKELFLNYPAIIRTEINASSVISILENEAFDLVLTDIQMPSIDGFELVQLIRNNPNNHVVAIPVVALSGKRDLSAKDFTDGGFNAHHPKPVQLKHLLDLISEILSGSASTSTPTFTTEKTQVKETGDQPLYNLRSLAQFTYNDPESLKTILRTFVESVKENCNALMDAVNAQSEQALAETAHKMIPMLKQMEVHSIYTLLEPLEDRTHTMSWPEVKDYVNDICARLEALCEAFEKEIN